MKNITIEVLNSTPYIGSQIKAAYTLGLLQIMLVPDETFSFADLCGDTYNPDVNSDIAPEQLAREKRAFRARVNRAGVYGVVLQCRAIQSADWVDIDSVWGFVGMDFVGSGYDNDFVNTANEWLTDNLDFAAIKSAVDCLT